uniref:Uncharacterized protein n=1 Tax=Hyaloperonospora arabidopsidis (strain Emoy2) TaxID=559515 RepID=M4BMM9_HYAAE
MPTSLSRFALSCLCISDAPSQPFCLENSASLVTGNIDILFNDQEQGNLKKQHFLPKKHHFCLSTHDSCRLDCYLSCSMPADVKRKAMPILEDH